MKAIITFTTLAALLFQGTTYANQLTVELSGINSNNGQIYVQLFKGQQNYKLGKAAAATMVSATKGISKVSFTNVEPGEYALRYFHDENSNGKLDTNLVGAPIEGYGFSNGAKPSFGPLTFEQIKFAVTTSGAQIRHRSQIIY